MKPVFPNLWSLGNALMLFFPVTLSVESGKSLQIPFRLLGSLRVCNLYGLFIHSYPSTYQVPALDSKDIKVIMIGFLFWKIFQHRDTCKERKYWKIKFCTKC